MLKSKIALASFLGIILHLVTIQPVHAYYEDDTPGTFNLIDGRIAFVIGTILNDGDPLTLQAINSTAIAFFGGGFTPLQLGEILDPQGNIDVARASAITDFDSNGIVNILEARIGFAVGQLDSPEQTVEFINNQLTSLFGSGFIQEGDFIPGSGFYPGEQQGASRLTIVLTSNNPNNPNLARPGDTIFLEANIVNPQGNPSSYNVPIRANITLSATSPNIPTTIDIVAGDIVLDFDQSNRQCAPGNTQCTVTQQIVVPQVPTFLPADTTVSGQLIVTVDATEILVRPVSGPTTFSNANNPFQIQGSN